jgi:hypothetical protein
LPLRIISMDNLIIDNGVRMDEKGFIFTVDASLALIVVIVFAASMATYYFSPIFMGDDHQHLEALADSALAIMEQDGTIANAAAESNKGNIAGAQAILNNRLLMLIPNEIAYNMSMTYTTPVTVQNDRGLLYSRDTATKVRVLSLPEEGWMGRAWYKIEKFEFEDQQQNVTTTLWNFHNWLTNFNPWSSGLSNYPYWGANTASPPTTIGFSFPTGSTILGAKYLSGTGYANDPSTGNPGNPFGTNLTINSGYVYTANPNQYTFLNLRPGTTRQRMYNYQGNLNLTSLNPTLNNFYLKFFNTSTNVNMPWFSIIGNYTTSFPVPKGIISKTFNFNDAAGMALGPSSDTSDTTNPQDLDGNGVANEYGRIYNLNSNTVSSFTNARVIPWNSYVKQDASNYNGQNFQNGVPFAITHSPSGTTARKSAVSIIQDVNIPNGNVLFDAYTVINPYGGVDGALVEVYNGTTWKTVFCSFDYDGTDYTDRSDGYGNIPGIIAIPTSDLSVGGNNKVRVTIWDDAPSTDYDLVGLVNCYTTVVYSALNIGWVNSYYDSHQSNTNTITQTKSFDIMDNAKNVYLFSGIGLDSRHLKVNYPSAMGGYVLYDSDIIPYYLDLAALDAAGSDLSGNDGPHKITTANSTATNYYLKTGTKYNLTVTVTGPPSTQQWQSGDWDSNAEIFSGTRISVIYPESLRNVWNIAYANDAPTAELNAKNNLIAALNTTDPNVINSIKTEALFTGNNPNQIPVRLTLWKD